MNLKELLAKATQEEFLDEQGVAPATGVAPGAPAAPQTNPQVIAILKDPKMLPILQALGNSLKDPTGAALQQAILSNANNIGNFTNTLNTLVKTLKAPQQGAAAKPAGTV